MYKFIVTKDEDTKNRLLKLGCKLLSSNNCVFVFENNQITNFSGQENLKIVHTNTLFI